MTAYILCVIDGILSSAIKSLKKEITHHFYPTKVEESIGAIIIKWKVRLFRKLISAMM